MIMSGGLFDYIEAQHILNSFSSTHERLSEVMRFNQFAQMFDISGEVNARRLVFSRNGFDEASVGMLGDISIVITLVIATLPSIITWLGMVQAKRDRRITIE